MSAHTSGLFLVVGSLKSTAERSAEVSEPNAFVCWVVGINAGKNGVETVDRIVDGDIVTTKGFFHVRDVFAVDAHEEIAFLIFPVVVRFAIFVDDVVADEF